jgi:hypothetical protein
MMFVSGLYPQVMKTANTQGDKVRLVPVDDSSLIEMKDPAGDDMYVFRKIPSRTYRNIQDGWFFGFFSGVKIIMVPADIVVANAWHTKNPETYDTFISEWYGLQSELEDRFN